MKTTYQSNRNVYYACHYHVVWCPKYRRKVLVDAVAERLKQIIREVCAEREAAIEALEVMPDHVHLVVSVDPLKGRSSRLLHQEFPRLKSRLPTLWTASYFVSTTGGAPLELVKQYLEGQQRG